MKPRTAASARQLDCSGPPIKNRPAPTHRFWAGLRAGTLAALCILAGCVTSSPRPVATESNRPAPPVAETPTPANPAPVPDVKGDDNASSPAPVQVDEENNVFFDHRSARLNDLEKEKLRRHADRLKQNPKTTVTLTAYSDDLGSRNYKLAVSEERLAAVSNLLKSYGVPSRQIRRNRSPSVKNAPACTGDCQRLKRRVELIYPE